MQSLSSQAGEPLFTLFNKKLSDRIETLAFHPDVTISLMACFETCSMDINVRIGSGRGNRFINPEIKNPSSCTLMPSYESHPNYVLSSSRNLPDCFLALLVSLFVREDQAEKKKKRELCKIFSHLWFLILKLYSITFFSRLKQSYFLFLCFLYSMCCLLCCITESNDIIFCLSVALYVFAYKIIIIFSLTCRVQGILEVTAPPWVFAFFLLAIAVITLLRVSDYFLKKHYGSIQPIHISLKLLLYAN